MNRLWIIRRYKIRGWIIREWLIRWVIYGDDFYRGEKSGDELVRRWKIRLPLNLNALLFVQNYSQCIIYFLQVLCSAEMFISIFSPRYHTLVIYSLDIKISDTQREIDLWFVLNSPKSDCIYHFPVDFEPNGILFHSYNTRKEFVSREI